MDKKLRLEIYKYMLQIFETAVSFPKEFYSEESIPKSIIINVRDHELHIIRNRYTNKILCDSYITNSSAVIYGLCSVRRMVYVALGLELKYYYDFTDLVELQKHEIGCTYWWPKNDYKSRISALKDAILTIESQQDINVFETNILDDETHI